MLEFILDINIEDKIEEGELKIDEEKEKFLDFRGKKRGRKLSEFFISEKIEMVGKKFKKVVDKKFSRLRGDKIIEEEGKSEDSLLVDKKNQKVGKGFSFFVKVSLKKFVVLRKVEKVKDFKIKNLSFVVVFIRIDEV